MAGLTFIFVILPVSVVLFLLWIFTQKKLFGYVLIGMWCLLISIWILGFILKPFYTKKVLDKSDYYGEYIIDRDFFSGKQADWQYNSFRFEIKENDSIYFYRTDGQQILETYRGTISTVAPYSSARLAIKMEQPTHHVLNSNPTIYRDIWSFFMVFNSPKFQNMYFKKGEWKPIE